MEKLKNPKVIGALRHVLTALGPILMLIGSVDDPIAILRLLISEAGWPAMVGLIMAVLGFYSSWTAPEKNQ